MEVVQETGTARGTGPNTQQRGKGDSIWLPRKSENTSRDFPSDLSWGTQCCGSLHSGKHPKNLLGVTQSVPHLVTWSHARGKWQDPPAAFEADMWDQRS